MVVLCCQSNNIPHILRDCDEAVRNSWMSYEHMEEWGRSTHYNAFGFQIHFREKVPFPEEWSWNCGSEFRIIVLPVSDWLRVPSKDLQVQTVWSCCIMDLNAKVKGFGSPNDYKDEKLVGNEAYRQLSDLYHEITNQALPKSPIITYSSNLRNVDGGWKSNNTGFTRIDKSFLPMRGTVPNLYALGCFTEQSPRVAYMRSAIDAAARFLRRFDRECGCFE